MAELNSKKVSPEDKAKMMQALQNFEKSAMEELESVGQSLEKEQEQLPDILQRLADVDLNNASAQDILSRMTAEEISDFEKRIQVGSCLVPLKNPCVSYLFLYFCKEYE